MNITGKTTIGELVRNNPKAVAVLQGFGLGCVGCPSAQAETVEEAASAHGLNLEELLKALNNTVAE